MAPRAGRADHAADYRDDDGSWWAIPLPELSGWRGRVCPDGSIQARHRDWPDVREVTVPAGADEPGRLLQALCGTAVFAATSLGPPPVKS